MNYNDPLFPTQEELLDAYLSYVIKDDEKRKIAVQKLLEKFSSVDRVLSSEGEEIAEILEIGTTGACFLKLISALHVRMQTENVTTGGRYSDYEIRDYLVAFLTAEAVECVYMAMFDSENRFLGAECVGRGSINSSNITVRRFLEIAMKKRATKVVLSHNHPSGLPTPSKEDIATTATIANALSTVGIQLAEHFVVAEGVAVGIISSPKVTLGENIEFRFASPTNEK